MNVRISVNEVVIEQSAKNVVGSKFNASRLKPTTICSIVIVVVIVIIVSISISICILIVIVIIYIICILVQLVIIGISL